MPFEPETAPASAPCPLLTRTPPPLPPRLRDGLPPAGASGWKHARGSHSLAWFMQEISPNDEAMICPNSHSPTSWYSCGSLAECRGRKTQTFARSMRMPLHLECIDQSPFLHGLCTKNEPYFLESLSTWGSGLTVACFLHDAGEATDTAKEHPGVTSKVGSPGVTSKDSSMPPGNSDNSDTAPTRPGRPAPESRVCSPPVPVDDLALVFAPIIEERRPNNPDLCGFYFFPYVLAETIAAHGQGSFEVNDFDIVWSESSYVANAADHPEKDYSLLSTDTYIQDHAKRSRPFLREPLEARLR